MAYPQEDTHGQRYQLSHRPPADAGSWLLAAIVFVISLFFGLTLLNGLIDETNGADAAAAASAAHESTPAISNVTTLAATPTATSE